MEESGEVRYGRCRCQRFSRLKGQEKKRQIVGFPFPKTRCRTAEPNYSAYRQRGEWRWGWAGRWRVPGCSSSWCWRWGACCDHMASSSAEPRWEAQLPEPGMQKCPWWGSPTTSALPSGESPADVRWKIAKSLNNSFESRTRLQKYDGEVNGKGFGNVCLLYQTRRLHIVFLYNCLNEI